MKPPCPTLFVLFLLAGSSLHTIFRLHLLYFAFCLLLYFVILFSYNAEKATSKVSMAPNQGQTRRDLRQITGCFTQKTEDKPLA